MCESGLIQSKGVTNDLPIGSPLAEIGISSGQEHFGGVRPDGKGEKQDGGKKSFRDEIP